MPLIIINDFTTLIFNFHLGGFSNQFFKYMLLINKKNYQLYQYGKPKVA